MASSIPPSHPDESKGPLLIGLTTTLAVFALAVFVLRIYTRLRPVFRLNWDDYAMMIAVASGIAQYAILLLSIHFGVGRHIEYVFNINSLMELGRLGFITGILWGWAVTFVKVSVACMMLRITTGKIWRYGMLTLIAFLFILAIVTMVLQCLQCHPLKAIWNPVLPGAVCRSQSEQLIVIYVPSALVVVTDVLFACLPLTFIVKLKRPLGERVVLAFLLGLGLFASACGIVKLVLLKETTVTRDPTWDLALLYFWSLAELYIGIFAACIPCLKSFMETVLRQLGTSISSKIRSKDSNGSKASTVGIPSSHQLKSFTQLEEQRLPGESKEHILDSEYG